MAKGRGVFGLRELGKKTVKGVVLLLFGNVVAWFGWRLASFAIRIRLLFHLVNDWTLRLITLSRLCDCQGICFHYLWIVRNLLRFHLKLFVDLFITLISLFLLFLLHFCLSFLGSFLSFLLLKFLFLLNLLLASLFGGSLLCFLLLLVLKLLFFNFLLSESLEVVSFTRHVHRKGGDVCVVQIILTELQ